MRCFLLALQLSLLAVASFHAAPTAHVGQLVVAVAPGWDASRGTMWLFEKSGRDWRAVGEPWPVLFGRNGLAWGRGVLPVDPSGLRKVERDKRAPAGLFEIGKVYGYAARLPDGGDYPYHQVVEGDAWIDDPALPHYNQFVHVDPKNPPPWFAKQKMRHGDFAYRWLVEIRHNTNPATPGAGSAIFLHIRRGVDKPTAGCTTMARENLERLICWLRAEKRPHFVLLPRAEYERLRTEWGLPVLPK
jgi:hypothetical protein